MKEFYIFLNDILVRKAFPSPSKRSYLVLVIILKHSTTSTNHVIHTSLMNNLMKITNMTMIPRQKFCFKGGLVLRVTMKV